MPSTNIRFLPAISGSGFAVMGRQRFFIPNISLTLGNFTNKFFTALYLSPTFTDFAFLTIPILLPPPEKIVLLCFIGCEIDNPAQFKICTLGPSVKKGWTTLVYIC